MKLSMQLQAKLQNILITDEHSARLPVVRITKIILQDFKNVEYGEIDFHCGKYFIPYGTKADILGLYGQNGSGKTALIDALYILKQLLRGSKVQNLFSECINKKADFAKLTFLFELQYEDGRVRKAMYEFCMKAVPITADTEAGMDVSPDFGSLPFSSKRVCIFNEILSMSGPFHGSDQRMNPVIDTTGEELPFGPKSRHKFMIGPDKNNRKALQLEVNKRLASERSQSFIFMPKTLEYLTKCADYSEYLQVILELNFYGLNYFFVVNTRSSGLIRLNLALLLHTPLGSFPIQTDRPTAMPQDVFEVVHQYIPKVNTVIKQLIPGLSIGLHAIAPQVMKDGSPGQLVEVLANRNGTELPLRDESDGIRRLISLLSLWTAAYNDPSFTLAIDEFDAGIFEYIWGEMLEIFAESGLGQLIFTAHNLRPLEVISKKFLFFTSTDPKDRYVQLKSIARTNNMRNVYFRQIENGNEEKVYNETKREAIKNALRSVKE
ncbi:MAG: AAA family ATPase [Acidaminococcaceae bacterium]|nr:AAA family ATPase [Acidaminococcaceae bacterium]MBO6039005.1 AAA family ATPase [Acidaminococcaceae bacterium]MBP5736291.1 AAA family ATPase [Acidaminococcaceae bacterium]